MKHTENRAKLFHQTLGLLLVVFLLAGCTGTPAGPTAAPGSATATPTATPTPTNTPTATVVLVDGSDVTPVPPTITLPPTSTPVPTSTPIPTPTSIPTATPVETTEPAVRRGRTQQRRRMPAETDRAVDPKAARPHRK